MSKIICVNGDSFTHEYYLRPIERWSTLIGSTDNLAMGGGSNTRIFYTTLDFLYEKTPDILIIGWTHWSRFCMNRTDGSKIVILNNVCFSEEDGPSTDYPLYREFYYKYCYNEFVNFNNMLNYMINLQEYCNSKKIKFLNFLSLNLTRYFSEEELKKIASYAFMNKNTDELKNNGIQHNLNILKNKIEKLDKNLWIKDKFYSMEEHCDSFEKVAHGHVGSEGSAYWANLVKEYL
jgi:hypothetical protein